MFVKVEFPETPFTKLSELYKGDSFILHSKCYRNSANVYVTMETPSGNYVKCFNLGTCSTEVLSSKCNVIEMVTEVHTRPKTDRDRNDLPF